MISQWYVCTAGHSSSDYTNDRLPVRRRENLFFQDEHL